MRKRSKPETVLQARIVEAIELAFPYARVLRMNSGEVRASGGRVKLAPKGFPDLMVLLHTGVVVFLEVKTKTGIASAEQLEWGLFLRSRHYKHSQVRTPQEALDFLARCA